MSIKALIGKVQAKFCAYGILNIVLLAPNLQADAHFSDQLIERSIISADQLLRHQQQLEKAMKAPDAARQWIELDINEKPTVSSGGPCFLIHSTQFIDSTELLPTPLDYQQLNGQCADKKALVELVESLNIYYQQAGLLTTRVYLQAQNLQSGQLILVAKAGLLEKFGYADGKPVDQRVRSAYAFFEGDLINLRDMEQGLDNLNRLSSQSATTELLPGDALGLSRLMITTENSKPWRVDLGLNNHGVQSTGTRKGSIGLGYDNLLNRNDDLSFNFSQNLDPSADKKRSRSLAFSYHLPWGNWLFNIANSRYNYQRILAGVNQDYRIDGYSSSRDFAVKYLLQRNQRSRVYATGKLSLKKSHNFIEDTEIQTQYRRLTLLGLGLRGDHQFNN